MKCRDIFLGIVILCSDSLFCAQYDKEALQQNMQEKGLWAAMCGGASYGFHKTIDMVGKSIKHHNNQLLSAEYGKFVRGNRQAAFIGALAALGFMGSMSVDAAQYLHEKEHENKLVDA